MALLLLALPAHCVNASSSGRTALLVTTYDPKGYSVKDAPLSCVISDYSKAGSQSFRSIDHLSFPKDKWVYIVGSDGSKRRMILEIANTAGRYFSTVQLDDQGRLVQSPRMIKLSKPNLQVAHTSEQYMIGVDYTDYTISTVQDDRFGDPRVVATYKLLSLNQPVAGRVYADAVPVSKSGALLTSEIFKGTTSGVTTVLKMLHVDSEGVIHEYPHSSMTLNGINKVEPDLSRNLVYVLTSNISVGLPIIHQYRVQPSGKLLEINLTASAFGDTGNGAAAPANVEDLRKVFPAPPVVSQPNPISVQSLKLCSSHHLLFGFGGIGWDEVYVWSIGKNGISHLLNRYHLVNGVLKRGATPVAKDQDYLPTRFDPFLDSNERNLYITCTDYGTRSQKVYKFKISNNGDLTSVPLDIPVETNRMIGDIKFVQY